MHILAIADDLTGALETGAKFAGAGVSAGVWMEDSAGGPAVTLRVIDTESRHVSCDEAYRRVLAVAAKGRVPLVYKKTDSTLRGNLAAEFRALLDTFPDAPLLYIPAYPEMGRTVVNGVLHVGGVPVHLTTFARDPLNPVRESFIPEVLRQSGTPVEVLRPGQRISPRGSRIYVIDGETAADVAAAARLVAASGSRVLAAGPAALAGELAARLALPRGERPGMPRLPDCIVINGSMHEVSAAQTAHALQNGFAAATFDSVPRGWSVLRAEVEGAGLKRARALGDRVAEMARRERSAALFVIGGDTAAAIVRALGRPAMRPLGEMQPGVPVTRAGDLHLISKAGGFGPPDLLVRLHRLLNPE